MSETIYRGPVPIETDLVLIRNKFPYSILYEGKIIPYEDLESILGFSRKKARFQSVIGKWKYELLIQHHISLITLVNQGYKVATDTQKLKQGYDQRSFAMRRIKKSCEIFNAIDTTKLNDEDKTSLKSAIDSSSGILSALAIKRPLEKPQIG